jgi:hemolysin D
LSLRSLLSTKLPLAASLGAKSRLSSDLTVVRRFQSETDAIREAPEPIAARRTVFVLTAFIIAIVVLLFTTRVDRIVNSSGGKIVTKNELLTVFQALDPSLIKSIDVREGDQVRSGQLLATLDQTFAEADVKQLKLQIASLDAQNARDEAELANKPLTFDKTSDKDLLKYQALQIEYYNQHVAQYKAQINSFDAKIKQLGATVQKLEADQAWYNQRGDIAGRIESMRTELEKKGAGSLLNLLQSQDTRIELARQIENTRNSLVEIKQTLDSATADREAFVQQWAAQLSQELVKGRGDLDSARAQYEKALKHQDLVRLTAPEPSVVLTLAKLSVGSVLTQGTTFMTLMPLNAPVEAETHFLTRDIGFIRTGDPCIIKVDSFNFVAHGTAEGKVRWISEGAFTTDDNNQPVEPYYKARCSVDTMNFYDVPPSFRLVPGMTLSADVKFGTRSVAMYLLGAVLRGANEAMREP